MVGEQVQRHRLRHTPRDQGQQVQRGRVVVDEPIEGCRPESSSRFGVQ
jgi:hypothetical protein